jgi:MFS family permease
VRHPVVLRLIAVLFVGQSLASVGSVAAATVDSIAAARVSGQAGLATVPNTILVLGAALAAYPVGRLMERFGRRPGLVWGFLLGALGAACTAFGVVSHQFPWMLIGAALLGPARAAVELGRYAAADIVPEANRARAVSWIVLAGTIGAVIGPRLAVPTGRLATRLGWEELSGPYVAYFGLMLIGGLVAFLALRPDPKDFGRSIVVERGPHGNDAGPVRSYGEVLRDRRARLALAAMVTGLFVMIMIMVITPLHMAEGHHNLDAVSWVFVAHVLGMYALSVVTGRVADSLGHAAAIRIGGILLFAAGLAAATAVGVPALALALFLLGLGWNFCYVPDRRC